MIGFCALFGCALTVVNSIALFYLAKVYEDRITEVEDNVNRIDLDRKLEEECKR